MKSLSLMVPFSVSMTAILSPACGAASCVCASSVSSGVVVVVVAIVSWVLEYESVVCWLVSVARFVVSGTSASHPARNTVRLKRMAKSGAIRVFIVCSLNCWPIVGVF